MGYGFAKRKVLNQPRTKKPLPVGIVMDVHLNGPSPRRAFCNIPRHYIRSVCWKASFYCSFASSAITWGFDFSVKGIFAILWLHRSMGLAAHIKSRCQYGQDCLSPRSSILWCPIYQWVMSIILHISILQDKKKVWMTTHWSVPPMAFRIIPRCSLSSFHNLRQSFHQSRCQYLLPREGLLRVVSVPLCLKMARLHGSYSIFVIWKPCRTVFGTEEWPD